MDTREMKGGYTTGSCATAGMKAALWALLKEERPNMVTVINPQDQPISVPVKAVSLLSATKATATVVKDGGDDPDVTHGTDVVTTVQLTDDGGLSFHAGFGVGTITKPGMQLPPGEPAINPGPRTMMKRVFDELQGEGLLENHGVAVTISVPAGEMLAKKTLNSTLGIEGGISIIGTTGIVKPMSEEAFKDSLVPQLKVMKAAGYETAVLVPGRIGQDLAQKLFGISVNQMAETSNFIGFMLEQCVKIGFKKIVIIGHVGKLIKLASGSFHTHNRMSDGRIETLIAYAALDGASQAVAEELWHCRTTEAAMPILAAHGLTSVYDRIAARASLRSERYIAGEAEVGIVLATMDGALLAMDETARRIGGEEQWHIPCM